MREKLVETTEYFHARALGLDRFRNCRWLEEMRRNVGELTICHQVLDLWETVKNVVIYSLCDSIGHSSSQSIWSFVNFLAVALKETECF